MKIKSATFSISAKNLEDCPVWEPTEVAFIGRSNVGKSSMINMLTNKDGLAKVSATPGKTRLLNFFLINESWILVDLPGYGYAKVSKDSKIDFNESVGDYLEHRENLAHVFVLIDSRLTPQKIDVDFVHWLSGCPVPFTLVFTKADKQSLKKTTTTVDLFLQAIDGFRAEPPPVIVSSSKDRTGRVEILQSVERAISSR
jgi:GTP-binding protein